MRSRIQSCGVCDELLPHRPDRVLRPDCFLFSHMDQQWSLLAYALCGRPSVRVISPRGALSLSLRELLIGPRDTLHPPAPNTPAKPRPTCNRPHMGAPLRPRPVRWTGSRCSAMMLRWAQKIPAWGGSASPFPQAARLTSAQDQEAGSSKVRSGDWHVHQDLKHLLCLANNRHSYTTWHFHCVVAIICLIRFCKIIDLV